MKKIKILLLSLSILTTFNVFAANLDVKFTDMKISGSDLIFDIEVKSTTSGTYIGGLEFYINYNTSAFGSSIANNVTATPIDLLVDGGVVYSFSPPANNSASRIKFSAFNLSGNRALMLTNYSKVYTVTIPIADVNYNAGISFQISLMTGETWYPTITGGSPSIYTPVTAANNLTSLPLRPANLIFSEVGDPSNTTTNFVEIYNADASITVDFTNHYTWYLNVNSTDTIKLTGTLAPSAKYTIAYNNTDFTPTRVSTKVGTLGTAQYLLTIHGDYTTGTAIDKYDGSGSGIAFTGKHAVRHYNIILPNTTFTGAEWVVSPALNTDMTPGSHGSVLNWSGATSADWRTKTNWGTGFIPDAGHNVSITSVGTAPVISNGDNAYCHGLAIASGSLTIESLPGSDGSLITYGTVTGNATVQRYLGADRYWYVTQPVTSATANVFLHMWLFTYSSGAWTPFIYDPTTPLNQMQGYAVWTSSINSYDPPNPALGSYTTSYNGILNTGDRSTSLITGWNFVGNPYPSAVDWEAADWTKTSLVTDAYSEWNGSTYGTYTAGSGGTNGATKDIPAAQGFFVNASSDGTLGVTNAVRLHSTQAFYKVDENMANRLSMTISNGEVNDETVIYFNENATTGLDYDYDAHKMMAEAAPQAYTMLAGEKMAINTFNNLAQTTSVILGVNTPAAGDYTITASNLESFDVSTPLFLEDIETGQLINLREVSSYTFTAGEGTAERFVVHFTNVQGISDQSNGEVNSIYAIDHNIFVDFNAVKGQISIYNILGREIISSAAKNGLNIISVPQGNAVYIVKVISDNAAVTKKVFVK